MRILNILVYATSLLATFSAEADTVLACQYTNSGGFNYKNQRWTSSAFILEKPFFIKIKDDGLVDPVSLSSINMHGSDCKRAWSSINPEQISCSSSIKFMQFNTKTLEGSSASLYGSVNSGNERDSVVVSLFGCQKM